MNGPKMWWTPLSQCNWSIVYSPQDWHLYFMNGWNVSSSFEIYGWIHMYVRIKITSDTSDNVYHVLTIMPILFLHHIDNDDTPMYMLFILVV